MAVYYPRLAIGSQLNMKTRILTELKMYRQQDLSQQAIEIWISANRQTTLFIQQSTANLSSLFSTVKFLSLSLSLLNILSTSYLKCHKVQINTKSHQFHGTDI